MQLIHFSFPKGDKLFSNPLDVPRVVSASGVDEIMARAAKHRRAVDAGAHVGLLAQAFAKRFNAVEAFEPQPACYACLASNLERSRTRVWRVGLTDRLGLGFANLKIGENSTQGRFSTQSFPNSCPIPAATLDSYGWTDVDVLRIGPATDPAAVLAGAAETLAASAPLIWITLPHTTSPEDIRALEQALLKGPLAKLGYTADVLTAPDDDSAPRFTATRLCFAANQESDRAAPRTLAYPRTPGRKVLLAPRAPDAEDGATPDAGFGLMNNVAWPARRRRLHADRGATQISQMELSAKTQFSGQFRLYHGGNAHIEIAPEDADTSVGALLDQIRITPVTGGLSLALTPESAALLDRISVTLSHIDPVTDRQSAQRCIYQRDIDDIANISDIPVALPRDALRNTVFDATVRFLAGDRVLRKETVTLDVARDHLSPALVTCYGNRGGGGNAAIDALTASLGARKAFAEDGRLPGVSVVWGVLRGSKAVIDAAIAEGGIFYYIDHAYFDRGHKENYRITRNGFEAGPVRDAPSDRLDALDIPLEPWRSGGREIIVCPPTDFFMEAHKCHDWEEQTLSQLKAHTDRPIVIRRKPKPGEKIKPLPEALETAHALVTHSSNVAIEAAVMGTPVFVSPTSAAAPVGLTDLSQIETPVRPERWAWLAHLAYSQFSFDEMQSGAVWQLLQEHEARPLSSLYPTQEAAE